MSICMYLPLFASHLPLMPFCSVHDTLFSAIGPLLKLIRRYSRCYVSLITAAPDPADGELYFST